MVASVKVIFKALIRTIVVSMATECSEVVWNNLSMKISNQNTKL